MAIIETVSYDRFKDVVGDNFQEDNIMHMYNWLWDYSEHAVESKQVELDVEHIKDMFEEVTIQQLVERESLCDSYGTYITNNIDSLLYQLQHFKQYKWEIGKRVYDDPEETDERFHFFDSFKWDHRLDNLAAKYTETPFKLVTLLDYLAMSWHHWLNEKPVAELWETYGKDHVVLKFLALSPDAILEQLQSGEDTVAKQAVTYSDKNEENDIWYGFISEAEEDVLDVISKVVTLEEAEENSGQLTLDGTPTDAPMLYEWVEDSVSLANRGSSVVVCSNDPHNILLSV